MEKRMDKKMEFPALPLWPEAMIGSFDPLGSYTGRYIDPDEKPIQDADDL